MTADPVTLRPGALQIDIEECEGHVQQLGNVCLEILDHICVDAPDIPKEISSALLSIAMVRGLLAKHVADAKAEESEAQS